MSKFQIYRADSSDPKTLGRRNKKLYSVYLVFFFLILITINLYHEIRNNKLMLIIYLFVMATSILTIALVIIKMRKLARGLVPIGTLEFTKTSIRKEIGSLNMTYSYDNILKIEAEQYMRDLSVSGSNSGAQTFVLKITTKDLSQDNFIISKKSTDFMQKFDFSDTFRKVKSMTDLDMIFIKN
jgi:hypothetical protein